MSQRRACQALDVDRSSMRYRRRRPDGAVVRTRLREIAAVRRRFGYRRLQILLQREGLQLNHKKLRRLYAEERLQVRRRGGRKRALGSRAPLALPQGPNQRWSTLCMISLATAGVSASSPWLTISPASAWRWSPTPRYRVCESAAR